MPGATNNRPYQDTTVSVDKSCGEVMQLLRQRSATGMQWTEEGLVTTLRFRWKSAAGAELCARFVVSIKAPPAPKGKRLTSQQIGQRLEQERRRMFRVLVYFIKNMFEAVDGGLLTLEQALLPYLEDATGRTVSEILAPHMAHLAQQPLMRALSEARP